MKSFNAYDNGTLITDTFDGMVMEIKRDSDGILYLCSDISAYPAWQFDPRDFVLHSGKLVAGDIDYGWRLNNEKRER